MASVRTACKSPNPSRFGIMTSDKIKTGTDSRAASNASCPSETATTSYRSAKSRRR